MFQRDYIIRLIEQLAKALLVFKKLYKEKRFDEARDALDASAKRHLGLDSETLVALPLDHVVTLLSPGGILDAGKCLVASELLYSRGELSSARDDDASAFTSRGYALGLLFEVFAREGPERIPDSARYEEMIETLDRSLAQYELPEAIQRRRIYFLSRLGKLAEAEDVLFELIEAGRIELIPTGVELYRGWLERSDAELERGGLPRAEVEEGLTQLDARAQVERRAR